MMGLRLRGLVGGDGTGGGVVVVRGGAGSGVLGTIPGGWWVESWRACPLDVGSVASTVSSPADMAAERSHQTILEVGRRGCETC
jgi:hypothetical protein